MTDVVFVLTVGEYSDRSVRGVCMDRATADRVAAEWNRHIRGTWDEMDVEEIQVFTGPEVVGVTYGRTVTVKSWGLDVDDFLDPFLPDDPPGPARSQPPRVSKWGQPLTATARGPDREWVVAEADRLAAEWVTEHGLPDPPPPTVPMPLDGLCSTTGSVLPLEVLSFGVSDD